MAIVTMKHLRLAGLLSDRDAMFTALQHLGCVEIREQSPSDPAWEGLVHGNESTRSEKERLLEETEAALTALDQYAPVRSSLFSPRPQITEQRLFDQYAVAETVLKVRRINGYAGELGEAAAEGQRLAASCQSLLPWSNLDIPLNTASTEKCCVAFGMLPASLDLETLREELAGAAEASELYESSTDSEVHYVLLLVHRSQETEAMDLLRSRGFTTASFQGITGTAQETIAYLSSQQNVLTQKVESLKETLSSCGDDRLEIQICYDRLTQEIQKERCKERLLDTDQAFFLEGWLPAQAQEAVGSLLSGYDCAYDITDPTPEEYPEVPVKLENKKVADSLNAVTNMYALPAYGSLDPNPLMAPFFILFFGFMMADMAYGLLMFFGCLIAIKKMRPRGNTLQMLRLFQYCGVSTFLFGILTGGFFGDMIPQLVKMISGKEISLPHLFSPVDDAVAVLIGSLALGLVQILTGMGVNMYKEIKRGNVMAALCGDGAWFVVFVLIGAAALTKAVMPCVIAIALVLVMTQGYGKKGVGGKLVGIGGSLYNHITGYFSDILSYSRLMALMLSGAVIAQVFNTLGTLTGNVVLFFVISLVGNALNLALSLLSCYVHDLRLQCLEFFGYFYEDGGKAFEPISVNTKYVDIIP